MEDMERGLQEMAQSVEHMQEMLTRSPMVQALAQHKPEVRAPSALRWHQKSILFLCTMPAGGAACSRFHPPQVICEQVVFTNSGIPRINGKDSREGTLDC